jgi:DNA-binding MarR family transcriptional regulator
MTELTRRTAAVGGKRPAAAGRYKPPLTISRRDYLRRDSDAAFREAIYALVQAVGRLLTCREAFGRSLKLTASQFAVLIGVAHQQGRDGVTIGQLSAHVALAPTHVTTEVGRLAARGLLIKTPSVSDRRSVLVSLSRSGKKAVVEVAPFVRAINDRLFDGITAEELETAEKVARVIFRNSDDVLVELRRRSREMRTWRTK